MAVSMTSYTPNVGTATIVGTDIAVSLPAGTDTITPTIVVSTGATVSPASGTPVKNIKTGKTVKYTVSATGETPVVYTATFTVATDTSKYHVRTIDNVGWFAAREVSGDLDAYVPGGLLIPLGGFKPKHVISIQIDGGFTPFFDLDTCRLKVYKAKGTEATVGDLTDVKYTLILMERAGIP